MHLNFLKCEFIFSYLSLNNINGPMEMCGLCCLLKVDS